MKTKICTKCKTQYVEGFEMSFNGLSLVDCRKCNMFIAGTSCILHDHILNLSCGYCKHFIERKNMSTKEAYKIMQAEWVKLYNVEVGDTVKILRAMITNELGCDGFLCIRPSPTECVIDEINEDSLHLIDAGRWPFFCLEFIKKAEPVIEITCKVNDKAVSLNTLSEETILNIRRQSK